MLIVAVLEGDLFRQHVLFLGFWLQVFVEPNVANGVLQRDAVPPRGKVGRILLLLLCFSSPYSLSLTLHFLNKSALF